MDPRNRIVIVLPLTELWTQQGPVDAVRLRALGRDDVAELLRAGIVQFVRADVASPLEWIDERERLGFWTSEVRDRVVYPAQPSFRLEDFPGGYCYLTSEWRAEGRPPIVLVERHH
jgi:nucleotidyltransferase/DNA polymerase involved in DNA repair